MDDADRSLLRELRTALLHLHKTLIDWQRAEYELDHGAMAPMQLLQVIFNDEQFAWLRSMSGLIVRIDEALEAKPPDTPGPRAAHLAGARAGVTAGRQRSTPRGITPRSRNCPKRCWRIGDLVTVLKLHNPPANA